MSYFSYFLLRASQSMIPCLVPRPALPLLDTHDGFCLRHSLSLRGFFSFTLLNLALQTKVT